MRAAHASGYGGFELYDAEKIAKLRGAFTILISVSDSREMFLVHMGVTWIMLVCEIESRREDPQWRLQFDQD